MILCLLSRGLLSAFDIEGLIDFIEEKKRYKTFVYIMDKICDSEGKGGIEQIKKKYDEYPDV